MKKASQATAPSLFNDEWKGMAQSVLKKSNFIDHPALSRLQTHAKAIPEDVIKIGCYSRMHHRHNR